MSESRREIIVVRSLSISDLGLFSAHRTAVTSKQRAININADVVRTMLSPQTIVAGGVDVTCICAFGGSVQKEIRPLTKVHKNWRLGGPKIEGDVFALIDSKDFMLIRSVVHNDGTYPVVLAFVSRNVDRVIHAGVAAMVTEEMQQSMAVFADDTTTFEALNDRCQAPIDHTSSNLTSEQVKESARSYRIPPMPRDDVTDRKHAVRPRTMSEKMREPHIMQRMLKVAGDLSAPAQLRFMKVVEELAWQLRNVLLETDGIINLTKDHTRFWPTVRGHRIGFVDGGLANLSMLGSAPIAARVGGYSVIPGKQGSSRERFIVLKQLIDELYTGVDGGIYDDSFPDIGALRDAARIAVEAAGAIRLMSDFPDHRWVLTHGALVNPVSRYSDLMQSGRIRHRFPDFSDEALRVLLPETEPKRTGRQRNFIAVHQRQLALLRDASAVVCGVIERESTTTSVCRAVLENLRDDMIKDVLGDPPSQWKRDFRNAVDPSGDDEFDGQRITDSLLFWFVLEPGEALRPIVLDRNDIRRAPEKWKDTVSCYPKPRVSYLQINDSSAPVRVEMFERHHENFKDIATLIYHCALLLPRYAFPVGLDIVDKFARIPNWMSRPVNIRTAVLALKMALDQKDTNLFDSLRRMLCGSSREFFLRPNAK